MVRLGLEFAVTVGANRGEHGELALPGNHEESQVTEGVINTVVSVIGNRPRVDHASDSREAGVVPIVHGSAAGRHRNGGGNEKLSAVHALKAAYHSQNSNTRLVKKPWLSSSP